MSVLSAFPLPPETTVGMGFPTDDSFVVSSFPPVAVAEEQGKDTVNTRQQFLQDPCLPQGSTYSLGCSLPECAGQKPEELWEAVAREEGILQKAQRALSAPLAQLPCSRSSSGPAGAPHKPGGKCSGLKPGRRNGGGGGGGTPGANPGGGIPKGAVKAGGWSAPTTGGPDGWGGT